jgi:hypothetical protein
MQIAVIRKAGEWTVLRDTLTLGTGVTRSAAIEIAQPSGSRPKRRARRSNSLSRIRWAG